jgi:hypothetical protein
MPGTEGASNARTPVRSRYNTDPSENTSLRASSGSPVACSGDMYDGVPKNSPALVSCAAGILAIPKSMSLGCPLGSTMMLAGFTSRWTMSFSCAWWRASATFAARRRASRHWRCPSRFTRSERVSPSRYSSAM